MVGGRKATHPYVHVWQNGCVDINANDQGNCSRIIVNGQGNHSGIIVNGQGTRSSIVINGQGNCSRIIVNGQASRTTPCVVTGTQCFGGDAFTGTRCYTGDGVFVNNFYDGNNMTTFTTTSIMTTTGAASAGRTPIVRTAAAATPTPTCPFIPSNKNMTDDEKHKTNAELRNTFLTYALKMRNLVNDNEGTLSSGDKTKIENAVNNSIQWLNSNGVCELYVIYGKMKALQNVCDPIIVKVYQHSDSSSAPKISKVQKMLGSLRFF